MFNSILNSLADVAASDESNRLERFRKAWQAYYGKLPDPLAVTPGKVNDNIKVNFARLIVDKGVSFLFGSDIAFEIDSGQEAKAGDWLAGCWQQNRKMSLLQKVALNGGVCGHAFIKIFRQAGLAYPRLINLDPETVTVTLAADDLEAVQRYQIQYPSRDPTSGKLIAIRQVIERNGVYWKITDQVGDVNSLNWKTTNEEVWLYPFAPIVECQNLPAPNEFWGVSDLEDDVIGVNQSVNFILSNTGRIIRFHAHPKTWGRGFSAEDLKIGVDETIVLPSDTGELHNLEMTNDLSSSIEFYKRLKEALHETSRIPEVATGKLESTSGLSGLALQILYQPLIEKTNTKRLMYGDMLVELNRRLLAVGGFGDQQITEIHWPDMLPQDPMQERQADLVDEQLGVSKDTLLTKLGYNPDLEKSKKQAEGDQLGDQLLSAFEKGQ